MAAALLAARPAAEIVASQQIPWDLLGTSYRAPLWAAAYTINGGCSDDGFDYVRGWLVLQGHEVFERAVADPDSLARSPVIRRASEDWAEVECESALGIAWDAHLAATGEELPPDCFRIRHPALDPSWNVDLDDWGGDGAPTAPPGRPVRETPVGVNTGRTGRDEHRPDRAR